MAGGNLIIAPGLLSVSARPWPPRSGRFSVSGKGATVREGTLSQMAIWPSSRGMSNNWVSLRQDVHCKPGGG